MHLLPDLEALEEQFSDNGKIIVATSKTGNLFSDFIY
jgi:hypothetical protein